MLVLTIALPRQSASSGRRARLGHVLQEVEALHVDDVHVRRELAHVPGRFGARVTAELRGHLGSSGPRLEHGAVERARRGTVLRERLRDGADVHLAVAPDATQQLVLAQPAAADRRVGEMAGEEQRAHARLSPRAKTG